MAQILVVAARAESSPVIALLKDSGHEVLFAPGFEAAIRRLDQIAPDLLITDVRLGGFNGLHLVIRSQSTRPKMRSILLDRVHDPVMAQDAERHGAIYVGGPVTIAALSEQISKLLNESGPQRRWPRKQPMKGLVFHVARRSARVIDISYGGIRLELPPAETIPAKFRMAIPGFEGVFRAKPVWSRYTSVGSISCGAELLEANPQIVAQWRQLVDSINAGAQSPGL
jgi:DNA-binding response OmpR family regulator